MNVHLAVVLAEVPGLAGRWSWEVAFRRTSGPGNRSGGEKESGNGGDVDRAPVDHGSESDARDPETDYTVFGLVLAETMAICEVVENKGLKKVAVVVAAGAAVAWRGGKRRVGSLKERKKALHRLRPGQAVVYRQERCRMQSCAGETGHRNRGSSRGTLSG